MRFVSPARDQIDPHVFQRQPLSAWHEFTPWLTGPTWPDVADLNDAVHDSTLPQFVAQTPALLADGLHYEQRIAERGQVATRPGNWHDLLNALVWRRFPALKKALNVRQVAEIAQVGPKRRTRAQCALTHFDEAGIGVAVRDPALLALWDAHDWHGLFWRERAAWQDGRIVATVFGHALLEHALTPEKYLCGKALVVQLPADAADESALAAAAVAIADRLVLNDPQELRPLPLSGIPGWHAGNDVEHFYRDAPCFQPLRVGRRYPAPLVLAS